AVGLSPSESGRFSGTYYTSAELALPELIDWKTVPDGRHLWVGKKKKLEVYEKILKKHGLKDEEVCYIGDDLIDLPVLSRVGLAVAVAGSPPEVLQAVDYVTRAGGGQGAVREVVEKILKFQGKWEDVLKRYA
ncbi:MAG: KdsC family phosphatase, partial [Candidatus Brocadiales bacterium]